MSHVEAAIIRKVAWRLVPFLCVAYIINALDRYNVSIAALTMNKDLGLSASAYGLAAGAYFWSYVLCQVPANLMLRKFGARAWLTIIMAIWGIASASTALVTGETSFVVARFVLGIAEAGYFPGVTYFMTCWFPGRYRGRMMGFFFAASAISSVLGAPLSANILRLDGWLNLRGWQWVFLMEGAPAVLLALVGYAILRNHPGEAPWLTASERTWLQREIDGEGTRKPAHGTGLKRAIFNRQIVTITIAFALILYGVYSVGFFLPLIIKGLGLSNLAVGYVSALPSLCSAIAMIAISDGVPIGPGTFLARSLSVDDRRTRAHRRRVLAREHLRRDGGVLCRARGPVIDAAGLLGICRRHTLARPRRRPGSVRSTPSGTRRGISHRNSWASCMTSAADTGCHCSYQGAWRSPRQC